MDTTTLLIVIIVVLLVLFIMNRSRGGYRPAGRSGYGSERPTYDDPDYTSSGSIGGTNASPRVYDDPNHTSAGSIGGASQPSSHVRERSVGEAPSAGRNDDPNYRSGGSIGGA
jgi:hypothetical protein